MKRPDFFSLSLISLFLNFTCSCFLYASGKFETSQGYQTTLARFRGEENPPDPIELRMASFAAMATAFEYYEIKLFEISEEEWKDSDRFNKKFINLWTILISAIAASDRKETWSLQKPNPNGEKIRQQDAVFEIETTLRRKMIPLPSIESQKDFSSTIGWIEALHIGIAPIDISKVSDQDYAKRTDHPIRTSFLSSKLSLCRHDVLHASEVSSVFIDRLELKDPVRKGLFTSLFRSTFVHFKEDQKARRALYYFLHEDSISPNLMRFSNSQEIKFNSYAFTEFALEQSLDRYPGGVASFLGTESEQKKVCAFVEHTVNSLQSLKRRSTVKEWIEHLIPKESFVETLNEIYPDSDQHDKLHDEIASGLWRKMSQVCASRVRGKFLSRALRVCRSQRNVTLGGQILARNFERSRSSGKAFSHLFFRDMQEFKNSRDRVMIQIKSDPRYDLLFKNREEYLLHLLEKNQMENVISYLHHYPDEYFLRSFIGKMSRDDRNRRKLLYQLYLNLPSSSLVEELKDPNCEIDEDLFISLLENSTYLSTECDRSNIARIFRDPKTKHWKKALRQVILLSVLDRNTYHELALAFLYHSDRSLTNELILLITTISNRQNKNCTEHAQSLYQALLFEKELWKDELNLIQAKFPGVKTPIDRSPILQFGRFSNFGG